MKPLPHEPPSLMCIVLRTVAVASIVTFTQRAILQLVGRALLECIVKTKTA